jgi:hypothetical protein
VSQSDSPPHTLNLKINTVAIFFISQQLKTLQHEKFRIKIAFAMTISKAKGQTLTGVAIYIYHRLFFPISSSMLHFPDTLHLTTSLLQLLQGVVSV